MKKFAFILMLATVFSMGFLTQTAFACGGECAGSECHEDDHGAKS